MTRLTNKKACCIFKFVNGKGAADVKSTAPFCFALVLEDSADSKGAEDENIPAPLPL